LTALLRARVNSKVNLWLAVRGRRPDGYHDIETIFCGVGLADDVTVRRAPDGVIDVDMRWEGPKERTIRPVDNIAYKATSALMRVAEERFGVRVEIVKRIPAGAGLGGGSADAAATLLLATELIGLPRTAAVDVACDIGSDVPYFLHGGIALATGRGERLKPIQTPGEFWLVLGLFDDGLATKDVYDEWDRTRSAVPALRSDSMVDALQSGDAAAVAGAVHNDLQAAAVGLRPGLEAKVAETMSAGALAACVSGSGPTVYGLASSAGHAREIAARLNRSFDRVVVAASKEASLERLD
jgi:4-diphosphocytidyl-2-C-methyl-D-erythritol kinase